MAKAMRFLAGMALSMGLALPVLAQEPAADTVVAVVNGTAATQAVGTFIFNAANACKRTIAKLIQHNRT